VGGWVKRVVGMEDGRRTRRKEGRKEGKRRPFMAYIV
jgi:hypothetical protein